MFNKLRKGSRVRSVSSIDANSTQTGTVIMVRGGVATVDFDHGKGRALRLVAVLKQCDGNDKARKVDGNA